MAEGGEGDAMRVVYRMRGLLGDATEEFVETLDAKSEQEVNNEEVYKMANVMADCGGLQVSSSCTCYDVLYLVLNLQNMYFVITNFSRG